MDNLQATDDQSSAVQKTPNRVTLASMRSKVKSEEYIHPIACPTMTIAAIEMQNGFVLVGKSAPADPNNFDKSLGKQFAMEDAMRQLWQLEGYLLREKLANEPA